MANVLAGWRNRTVLSYVFDYVIIVVLILGFSALDRAEPFKQHFSLTNESLQYPYADPERISPFIAGLISCLFPMLCIIAWTMLIDGMFSHHKPAPNRARIMGGPWTIKMRLWQMNCGILGLGLSVAGAICVTGALKNATGKPRPDVIARCVPPAKAVNRAVWGLFDPKNCTGDPTVIKDGFKSFPSGHSSTGFAGLGYLSLFLAGKLHIMDNRGEVWKTFIVLVPLLAAALIAVSRIMDARHHPFDVITGSMLGLVTAWVAYRQYFPSLSDYQKKGRAYDQRTWGTEAHDDVVTQLDYTPYNLRTLEEGHSASADSLESDGKGTSRKRGVSGIQGAGTYTDAQHSQGIELLPQTQRSGTFPPEHPRAWPQQQQQQQQQQPKQQDNRASVDMGERSRREPGLESPESVGRPLRVERLSSPPADATRVEGRMI